MNKFIKFAIVAVMAVAATQTAQAQFLKNLLGGKSATTETAAESQTAAYSNGQTSGTALKALYTQYKTDGKNLNMSNMQNMLNLASLATSVQGLKGADAAYKKDFLKGMILGSSNLVNNNNSTSVMSSLTNFANLDLSSLLTGTATNEKKDDKNAEITTATGAVKALSGLLSGSSDDKKTEETDQSEIISSVSTLLNLFK